MNKLLIPLLAIFLSGCATYATLPPKVAPAVTYNKMDEVPEPDQKKIVLAIYQFADMSGQQKPNTVFGEMSKAVTQGSSVLLINAIKEVGQGKWFRVAERESLQSLLQERKLIRTTRQITQGDKAKPLGPMLYAGAYVTGGIVGYDSNTLTGGAGHRFLGIGASVQYRQDVVTVALRLINVVSGEVELSVLAEKKILSVGVGGDKFKYLDTDTNLLEIELGIGANEPVTYAVRKAIEASVVELVMAGERKGLWKFKPPPIPPTPMDADEFGDTGVKVAPKWEYPGKVEVKDGSDGSETLTEEDTKEILEELKEEDSEVEDVKQSIPKEVFTQKLLDELECGVNPHKLMCLEKDETSNNDTTTISDDK
jgi:curli production assembly/transport component CsgG